MTGCGNLRSQPIQVEEWAISTDEDLKDLGVTFVRLNNSEDSSQVSVLSSHRKVSAIGVFTERGENVGIQYRKDQPNKIQYIKVTPSFNQVSNDERFLKLLKNEKNNWVLVEYADASEKKILRKAELK